MKIRLRWLLALAAMAALGGCGQDAARPTAALPVSDATVIISVSHSLAEASETSAYFYLDEDALGGRGLLATPLRNLRSDFPDRRGQLLVLHLQPGVHTIDRWQLETSVNMRKPARAPRPLVFEVKAGEVVYLGNLHLALRTEPGAFGAAAVAAVAPQVRDMADQDLPLAEQREPALKGRIQRRLLVPGPW